MNTTPIASTISLLLTLSLLSAGCVAVQEVSYIPDPGEVPPGYAVLFIAVPLDAPNEDPKSFELEINGKSRLTLKGRALNRIYIPEGSWTLKLPNVPQEENNSRTYFNFEDGDIVRLMLVERGSLVKSAWELKQTEESSKPVNGNDKAEYALLPSKRTAFEELMRNNKLPLVVHHVQ